MATAKCHRASGAYFTRRALTAQIQLNVKRILYIKYLITLLKQNIKSHLQLSITNPDSKPHPGVSWGSGSNMFWQLMCAEKHKSMSPLAPTLHLLFSNIFLLNMCLCWLPIWLAAVCAPVEWSVKVHVTGGCLWTLFTPPVWWDT